MGVQMMIDGQWVDLPTSKVDFTTDPTAIDDVVETSIQSTYTLDLTIKPGDGESLTRMINRAILESWWRHHGWLRAMIPTRGIHLPTCGARA